MMKKKEKKQKTGAEVFYSVNMVVISEMTKSVATSLLVRTLAEDQ